MLEVSVAWVKLEYVSPRGLVVVRWWKGMLTEDKGLDGPDSLD